MADDIPRPFNLMSHTDLSRLFREVAGYLRTCQYQHGTDWKGREYAMNALNDLYAARELVGSEKKGFCIEGVDLDVEVTRKQVLTVIEQNVELGMRSNGRVNLPAHFVAYLLQEYRRLK